METCGGIIRSYLFLLKIIVVYEWSKGALKFTKDPSSSKINL
jgi:hypothetical protein